MEKIKYEEGMNLMRIFKSKRLKLCMTGVAAILLCMIMVLTAFAASDPYQLGTTEKAWWSGTTVARWKKVDRAKRYQVRLYEDGVSRLRLTVENTSVDFSQYMVDGGEYYFEVCAYAKGSNQRTGDWVESESKFVSGRGDMSGRWRTYQQGKKYLKEDNSYVTDAWYLIAGKWYNFDADGYAKTGWSEVGGKWYYFDSQGIMQTGWLKLDGADYYLNSDGSMAVGWVQYTPGEWSYMYSDGKMASNTVIDGYQLDKNGRYMEQK